MVAGGAPSQLDLGRIAVQNAEIDLIWAPVADGTPIAIRP